MKLELGNWFEEVELGGRLNNAFGGLCRIISFQNVAHFAGLNLPNKFVSSKASVRLIVDMSGLIPPRIGKAAPVMAEPAPQGVTGTLFSLAHFNKRLTDWTSRGLTTTSGR